MSNERPSEQELRDRLTRLNLFERNADAQVQASEIAPLFESIDREFRERAAWLLSVATGEGKIGLMQRALRDSELVVRLAALEALGEWSLYFVRYLSFELGKLQREDPSKQVRRKAGELLLRTD